MTQPEGLRTSEGKLIVVDSAPLSKGGSEGVVWPLIEPAGRALKHYHPGVIDEELQEKLTQMIKHPPLDPMRPHDVSIAWPETLAIDKDRRLCGYVMPQISSEHVELHQAANPHDRKALSSTRRRWLGGFRWDYLVRTAKNLAVAVDPLHDTGYVIGDFNARNILVTRSAVVAFVDCDSFQVPRGVNFLPFKCKMFTHELLAPELIDVDLSVTPRQPASDLFALAVHIYQLLMEGWPPFSGRWNGPGEKPSLHDLARQGIFAQSGDSRLSPSPHCPDFSILPESVQAFFIRAFHEGAHSPSQRPSGMEWYRALDGLEREIVVCARNHFHRYIKSVENCPWCAREGVISPTPQQRMPPSKEEEPIQFPTSWPTPFMPSLNTLKSYTFRIASSPPPPTPSPSGPSKSSSASRPKQSKIAWMVVAVFNLLLVLMGAYVILHGLPRQTGGPVPSSIVSPDGVPSSFSGTWHGLVKQTSNTGNENSFHLLLKLEQGNDRGTLEIPDSQCTGSLELTRASRRKLTLRLTFPSDQAQACHDGTVTLAMRRNGDSLKYRWLSETGTSSSKGILHRSQ
ncbi:hypothetical protein [Nonomuraea sp. B19D2]|uniref:hypothetical protein n=1 Tax=Nonomuraea sp. B19D2 TaxID=3159561 RepID=UPI0032DA0171